MEVEESTPPPPDETDDADDLVNCFVCHFPIIYTSQQVSRYK